MVWHYSCKFWDSTDEGFISSLPNKVNKPANKFPFSRHFHSVTCCQSGENSIKKSCSRRIGHLTHLDETVGVWLTATSGLRVHTYMCETPDKVSKPGRWRLVWHSVYCSASEPCTICAESMWNSRDFSGKANACFCSTSVSLVRQAALWFSVTACAAFGKMHNELCLSW